MPYPDRRPPSLDEAKTSRKRNSLARHSKDGQEVAGHNTFFQIRDSAVSNPRIWIVYELLALSIKGPGKAERIQRAIRHHLPLSLSLSLFLSSPPIPVSLKLICTCVCRLKTIQLLVDLQHLFESSPLAQGPVTRSSPDPGVTPSHFESSRYTNRIDPQSWQPKITI